MYRVSSSSEVRLEVGDEAGRVRLGKLDINLRHAFKEEQSAEPWRLYLQVKQSVGEHMAEDEKAVGFRDV